MVQQENAPSVDEILDRMKAHDEWQGRYLIEYRAQRKFYATNLRFKEEATLEVRTTFRRPDTLESEVLRAEGSKIIRERVFDKILEAENETRSALARQQIDIVLANYSFRYLGREDCASRECYRLGITPRRKEKLLIEGQIWVDAEDWGIVRIQGSPAKRPSFWARQTQIDRRYKRIYGMWLDDRLESISDVFIAGRSSLKIQYSYESIQTDAQYGIARVFGIPDYNSVSSDPRPASTIREEVYSASVSSWQRMHIVAHGTASRRLSLMSWPQWTHSPY
jgi:hypothetical protein